MDLKSIKFFVAVAETGSITRAAGQLGLVQPALTRHINKLEQEFGVRLFTRQPRGVQLTAVGRDFLEHCRRITDEVERARHEISSKGSAPGGSVVLGTTTTLGRVLMPTLVGHCLEQLPQVVLRVVEARSVRLHEQLLVGALDMAILTNPVGSHQLSLLPLMEEPLCVVGPWGWRARGTSVPMDELGRLPLVVTPGMRALASGPGGRRRVDLNIVVEIDSIETIRVMVIAGKGFTIVPESALLEDLRAQRLQANPLNLPGRERRLVLATRTDNADLPAVRQLSRIVRQAVEETMRLASHPSRMPLNKRRESTTA
jgi:LysR family nitrogen assimilation transcriptional regulator